MRNLTSKYKLMVMVALLIAPGSALADIGYHSGNVVIGGDLDIGSGFSAGGSIYVPLVESPNITNASAHVDHEIKLMDNICLSHSMDFKVNAITFIVTPRYHARVVFRF